MTNPSAQTRLELADELKRELSFYICSEGHRDILVRAEAALRASQPAAQAPETLYRQVITKDRIHYEAVVQAPAGTRGDVRETRDNAILTFASTRLGNHSMRLTCNGKPTSLAIAFADAILALSPPAPDVVREARLDKYGIALMMISHGCADPISVADKALAKGWLCKVCGWQGEMPNTKVLPDAMGTAQTPCCPDCDQHVALAPPDAGSRG